MILIKNSQRKISFDQKIVKSYINKILSHLGYSDFDIGIWFTTNQTIRKYNCKFRKKDKATDVLSFPYHTNLKAGQKIKVKEPEDKNLGDIIISLEYCKKSAKELNTSFENHLKTLIIHGISHLLGFDHKKDEEYEQMRQFENKLLKISNLKS